MAAETIMSFSILKANLEEIVSAPQSNPDKAKTPILVAFRGRVYDAHRGWGRLFRLFDRILILFGKEQWVIERLHGALLKTQEAFREHSNLIMSHSSSYGNYLRTQSTITPSQEAAIVLSRKSITEWNNAFKAWKSPQYKTRIENISNAYKAIFNKGINSDLGLSSLQYNVGFSAIAKCQRIIDLEGLLQESLPILCLEKLHNGQKLTEVEQKKLQQWALKLNGYGSKLTVRQLHRALQSLVTLLNVQGQYVASPKPDVGRLEWELVKLGCKLFNREEESHKKMVAKAESTKKITINKVEYSLQSFMGSKKKSVDAHTVYTLASNPLQVAVFGINEAALGIERARNISQQSIIPIARWDFIDEDGKSALVERLQRPFTGIAWKSTSDILHVEDVPIADGVVRAIASMLQRNEMPDPLLTSHLMFDAAGNLKIARAYEKTKPIDFNALVELAELASNGNYFITAHILSRSGLASHPYAEFYRNCICQAFKGDKSDVALAANLKKIADNSIINKARKLQQDVLALRDSCWQTIKNKYVVPIYEEDMKTEIAQYIWDHYQRWGLAGIIGKTWQDNIVKVTVTCHRLTERF